MRLSSLQEVLVDVDERSGGTKIVRDHDVPVTGSARQRSRSLRGIDEEAGIGNENPLLSRSKLLQALPPMRVKLAELVLLVKVPTPENGKQQAQPTAGVGNVAAVIGNVECEVHLTDRRKVQ